MVNLINIKINAKTDEKGKILENELVYSIDIYNKLLNKDLPQYYIPHITLGSVDEIVDIDLNDCFETEISKIAVETIGDNEESFINFYVTLER